MPVYNSGKYLGYTLNSIKSQKYINWELIIVDDGSTDSSGIICDGFSSSDSRIVTHHIANHGVSYARNYGLDHCNGEFFVFCDADDMLSPNYLSRMKEMMDDVDIDIAMCTCSFVDSNANSYCEGLEASDIYVYNKNELATTPQNIHHTVWGKMFRTNTFGRFVRFDNYLNRGEDTLFVYRSLVLSNKVAFTNSQLINYRILPTSLMRRPAKPSLFKQSIYIYREIKKYLSCHDVDGNFSKRIISESLVSVAENLILSSQNKTEFHVNILYLKDNNIYGDLKLSLSSFTFRSRLSMLFIFYGCGFGKHVKEFLRQLVKIINIK